MGAIEDLEELQRHNFFFTQESWSKPQINNTTRVHSQLDKIARTIEAMKIVIKYQVDIADILTSATYEEYVSTIREYFSQICKEYTKERREKVIKSWTMSEEDFNLVQEELTEIETYLLQHRKNWRNNKCIIN